MARPFKLIYPDNLSSEILVIRVDPVVETVALHFRPVHADPQEVLLGQCQP